jgi:glycosyltransferase involved in cell wall biosynthesis
MKIIHVITDLSAAGAQTMLAKLLSGMDRARFDNRVVSLSHDVTLGPRIEALGVPVHALGVRHSPQALVCLARLARMMRRERPDVVQTWLYHADLLGTVAARLAGVRHVAWNIRCSDIDFSKYAVTTRLVVALLKRMSGRADAVLANSEAGRAWHERLGYHPRRWLVIPNGIDTDVFRPGREGRAGLRAALGVAGDTPLIGMFARYDPQKDHATLLRAAGVLAASGSAAHLVLVGRGCEPANGELAGLVRESGAAGRIHLMGERGDVADLVAAMDLATLSSAYGEGFSNAIGEAMAAGVPCVATDVGDAAAIIGDSGIVVPPGDAAALAAGWSRLLDEPADTRMVRAANARNRITENYSLPVIVGRYEAFYDSLVAG